MVHGRWCQSVLNHRGWARRRLGASTFVGDGTCQAAADVNGKSALRVGSTTEPLGASLGEHEGFRRRKPDWQTWVAFRLGVAEHQPPLLLFDSLPIVPIAVTSHALRLATPEGVGW